MPLADFVHMQPCKAGIRGPLLASPDLSVFRLDQVFLRHAAQMLIMALSALAEGAQGLYRHRGMQAVCEKRRSKPPLHMHGLGCLRGWLCTDSYLIDSAGTHLHREIADYKFFRKVGYEQM